MGALYSHSRLSSFENCPKQFEFRYIQKIPSETESIESFVGKRVHEILERLYLFVGRDQIPGVEKVVDRYQKLWEETYDGERVRIAIVIGHRKLKTSCESVRIAVQPGRPFFTAANSSRVRRFYFPSECLLITSTA